MGKPDSKCKTCQRFGNQENAIGSLEAKITAWITNNMTAI